MAYNTKELFEKAKEQIVSKRLIFIEEVVAFIGIAKPTFYEHFKIDSNEMNELKELIEVNKINLKTSMRKKWYDSDNPTLQMGLMKLLSTQDELRKLSMNVQSYEGQINIPVLTNDPLADTNESDNGTKENIGT